MNRVFCNSMANKIDSLAVNEGLMDRPVGGWMGKTMMAMGICFFRV